MKISPLLVGIPLAVVVLIAGFFVGPLKREVPRPEPKPLRTTPAYRWSHLIQRRPWRAAIVGAVALLVLAVPTLSLRLGFADESIGLAYVNLTATLLAATHCEEAAQTAAAGLEHARRTGTLATDGVLLAYGGAEALCCLGAWDEAAALLAAPPVVSDGPHGTTGAVISAGIAFAGPG